MSGLVASLINVRRGGRAILDGVSFTARAGDFVAVIGANGAGKSTLLAVLAGLLKPDIGEVEIGGKRLSDIPGHTLARVRAYLPQNPRVEWPIPVERLVALGLTPRLPAFGALPEAERQQVADMLAQCDLAERAGQAATTLSGGELARAMLARALIGDPDILIVDEPIAGLDPGHAMDAARRLGELARSGKTVIAALHDLTLAGRHASRIVALKDGRIEGEGDTGEILNAGLIGKLFNVEACVSGAGETFAVDFLRPL